MLRMRAHNKIMYTGKMISTGGGGGGTRRGGGSFLTCIVAVFPLTHLGFTPVNRSRI